ncbi:MAG TPA: 1-deoxy-D-xylulose-5-phosphate synthase, partial [Bacillota bacterium]
MSASLLAAIHSPADVKRLTLRQRRNLAQELRRVIIDTVARTGGHLGAALGAVELAIALHTVFNSPVDKIIWDVGHQSYAHKLLTGRRDRFHTLRQTGGLSGFPKRSESEHDAFGTAHASTALSAAYGFAKARDLRGERHAVVAVVGDGALTGGMAYEALNNIGHDGTNLIVLLNDNSMSIAPNVGAISTYLRRIRTDPNYLRARRDLERLLKRIPAIGSPMARTLERLRDSLKQLILPGQFFEELGFRYLGPIDGHDLRTLEETLRQARQAGGPVVIHAVTVKGKGYQPAEGDPYGFHGTGPFVVATGEGVPAKAAPPSYSSVFAQTLIRLAEADERICAITAAMPDGTGLEAFRRMFPRRFFDVGIAEQHAVTFAAGLACGGMRPFVAIYSTFLQRAYDQVIHDVAIQRLPVTLCIDRAGIVGADGETHQGAFDLAYLRCIPQLT